MTNVVKRTQIIQKISALALPLRLMGSPTLTITLPVIVCVEKYTAPGASNWISNFSGRSGGASGKDTSELRKMCE